MGTYDIACNATGRGWEHSRQWEHGRGWGRSRRWDIAWNMAVDRGMAEDMAVNGVRADGHGDMMMGT